MDKLEDNSKICLNIKSVQTGVPIKIINIYKNIVRKIFTNLEKDTLLSFPSLLKISELHIGVSFVNDEEMKKLNFSLRGINLPTNVLSLQMYEAQELIVIQGDRPIYLGDIIVSIPTLVKETQDSEITIEKHLVRLIIHGLLHILGYNHETEQEARQMYELEESFLMKLGMETTSLVSNYWARSS